MSIKYYANKVQETSTTVGAGNLILSGAPLGFKTFVDGIGASKKLTYYIYRLDTNFEWEIGVGYVISSGGINQLVRENVLSSTNGNSFVGFTSGTKYVETILSQDRANTSFINVDEKSANFSPDYIPATYIIDASAGNVQVNLPQVSSQSDPIILGFLLNKTTGSVYEQIGAITLVPSGLENIDGDSNAEISILNDYLQLVSVPSQSGWLKLDPIQESTYPFGNDGFVQFKYDNAFSGVGNLVWDYSSNSLLIGNSGNANADIVLASSGQTVVFNQRLYDADFRVAGTGTSHLLYVDGGSNRVAINTSNTSDALTINAANSNGLTVYKSGVGPQITIGNTAVSGLVYLNEIGSIVYSGLNSSNSPVDYVKITSNIESPIAGSESSSVSVEIFNNGADEEVARLSPSGITLGFNNSNTDGTIIGGTSSNEGNNVVLGYFNNVCGENCVVIGDNSVVNSGTFGGTIGSEHAVSGTNIWVVGGSGVVASGNNKVYLAVDGDNYLSILDSGNIRYNTLSNSNTVFSIKNDSVSSSGLSESLAFVFNNVSGTAKTGLVISSTVDDASLSNESSRFSASIIVNDTQTKVIELSEDRLVVGNNSYSGNNIIYGQDNIVYSTGNLLLGNNIVVSGIENVIVGRNIECSGINNTILGQNNSCVASGDLNLVVIGNDNQALEDYAVAIGNSNANSGLRSVSCGYSNGAHGEYSLAVGLYNLVEGNGSVAIGRSNDISTTDIYGNVFALGIANNADISNTGIIVGVGNEMYGSGSIVVGQDCWVSGANNLVFGNSITYSGNNSVVFSGINTNVFGTTVTVSGVSATNINGNNIAISGANTTVIGTGTLVLKSNDNQKFVTSPTLTSIYGLSGIYVSGISVDIYGSGLGLNATTDIELTTNSSNKINIWTTGIDILGSDIDISSDAYNGLRVASTGVDVYSLYGNVNIQADSSNSMKVATTGIDIKSSIYCTIGYDTNHHLTVTSSYSKLQDATSASVEVDSNKKLAVTPSESTLSSDALVKTYFSSNTKTELQSSGYDITAYSGVRIKTDANYWGNVFNLAEFNNNGFIINDHSPNWWLYPSYTTKNTLINSTGVFIYNKGDYSYWSQNPDPSVVFASGKAGFRQPNPAYTVDVSGDFRFSNTSAGLIYENCPTATGVATDLVIEDNIIKVSNNGIMSTSFPSSSIILYSNDKKIQLLDPGYTGTFSINLEIFGVSEGKEFYIRNTSDDLINEPIDIIDNYSATTICSLGGASTNVSCHVVFDGTQWRLVMLGL